MYIPSIRRDVLEVIIGKMLKLDVSGSPVNQSALWGREGEKSQFIFNFESNGDSGEGGCGFVWRQLRLYVLK